MMSFSWTAAACVIGGGAAAAIAGQSCVVSDDFSGGGLTDIWEVGETPGSVVSTTESGGQVRFSAAANNDESFDVAFVLSSGWYMDMTSDWAISGWWYSNPPTPTWGDTGIALGVMLDAVPSTAYLTYGCTVGVGRYNVDGDNYRYEECNTWWYNDYYLVEEDYNFTDTSGTLYVWYDESADTLYFGGVLYGGDSFTVPSFQSGSPSNSQEALIGFGAYSAGYVPAYSSSTYRGDDFCILDGNVVGPDVGACCSGFACVETIEASCDGEWEGAGTSCDTACGAEGACCVGTSCQTLTAAECHDAGGSYHGDGVSCAATPCGGGAGCPSGWAEDCVGICFPDAVFDEWLGDEFCDNAAYIPADNGFSTAPPGVYIYLACEAFLCDGGDCIGDPSSSCGPQCQGDVDADGDVDRADIVALIQAWSTTHAYADLDGDSNIDVQDLLLVCTYFGPCS